MAVTWSVEVAIKYKYYLGLRQIRKADGPLEIQFKQSRISERTAIASRTDGAGEDFSVIIVEF